MRAGCSSFAISAAAVSTDRAVSTRLSHGFGLTSRSFAAFLAHPARRFVDGRSKMAKAASLKIKLLSTADTGYFYVAKKRRKHVEFKETKIK